jgi:hypothetical protein
VTPTLRTAILIAALAATGPWATLDELAAAESEPAAGNEPPRPEVSRVSPAQIFNTTVPRGVARYRLFFEYGSEAYEYVGEDLDGAERDYRAETFFELTYVTSFSYGLTDHWEVGFALPVVTSFFEGDANDRSGYLPAKTTDTTLGNVSLLVSNGHTWRDGAETLLFELEVGLLSDYGKDPFNVGGHSSLAVTGEHYWDFYGIIGFLEGTHVKETGFDDEEWSLEYLIGVGLDLSREWFVSVLAGEADGTPRIEVEGQFYFNSSATSLKMFAGLDTDSPDTRFIGVGLTYLIGGSGIPDRASETYRSR